MNTSSDRRPDAEPRRPATSPPARPAVSRRAFTTGAVATTGLSLLGTQSAYVRLYTRDRNALRATFGLYRAWDATVAQNLDRQNSKLTIPVLGVGGENSWGPLAAAGMFAAATDVQTAVIPGAGHWVAEQAPAKVLAELTNFLAPYHARAASRR